MAKTYRVNSVKRIINSVFMNTARAGRGNPYLHVLTVSGRTTGRERSVPVDVMAVAGERYLVAPYGDVNWVRNVRAATSVTLQRGRQVDRFGAVEVSSGDAVPVIREYVRLVPVTRAYWNVDANSSDQELLADAETHPVFKLSPLAAADGR